MSARVTPYLSFAGDAREAMEFYTSVFGGELELRTFADLRRPGSPELIGHAMLDGATGVRLMASDEDDPAVAPSGGGFSIALGGDETELREHWAKLSEGGTVVVPFGPSAWGALYGHCVDRFGTRWLVNVTAPATAEGG